MQKKKFFITTTIPLTFLFFQGQLKMLAEFFDVTAVTSSGKLHVSEEEQKHFRLQRLEMEREISLVKDFIALLKWIWLLICERPYVVHANTPKASLLAMVAAWITCRPVRIYMCHGLRYQGSKGLKRKLLMNMERISCFCANRVICVSQGVREQFAEDNICKLDKSQVILYGSANGINTDDFDPDLVDAESIKEQFGLKETDFVCSFVGRVVRDKGIEELVDATIRLRNEGIPVKLLLIGPKEDDLDSLSERTIKLISANNFIIECGFQTDVRPFVKASQVLVLPSYREGFGQVLVEANSLGVPVIASRIIGCKNVVEEGVNGLLCEPADLDSLSYAMRRIMLDDKLYDRIKDQCRQYTISHFDRKKVASAYMDYYTHL